MKEVLIVVDMQNDFITGSLGSEDSKAIVNKVANKIKNFEGEVIYTQDTHNKDYLSTREGSYLPVIHCQKGSDGWKLNPQIQELVKDSLVIEKEAFSSFELLNDLKGRKELTDVTLIGLCTDYCVISIAMTLIGTLPNAKVHVDASCVSGLSKKGHINALEAMKTCQIDVING